MLVAFLAVFSVLSMWCGIMDTLYDIRRDVQTLLVSRDHDEDSVYARVSESTCESDVQSNVHLD